MCGVSTIPVWWNIKMGFGAVEGSHHCVKLSKKNSCFLSDVLVLQRKQTKKKPKTPPEIILNLPNTHFPIPCPPPHLCKTRDWKGLAEFSQPSPPSRLSRSLGPCPPPLVTSFLPLLMSWWQWGVPVGHPHQCNVWNCHCWEVYSLRKPSEKTLWHRAVLFPVFMGSDNYTSKFSPNVRPISYIMRVH